jgi:hypothetical protein
MRRLPALALSTLALTPALALLPSPAQAGSTNVTFTLTGGTLTLSAPTTASLSTAALAVGGTSVSGTLGNTTVTDTQGAVAHTDTVNMSSTDFTSTNGTITKSNAGGYSGVPSAVSGVGVPVPTASAQTIGAAGGATILQLTGVIGSASVTYNPTVDVTIPANAVAGAYSGTVTQTVS